MILVGMTSLPILFYLNHKMIPVLSPYVEMEVERFTRNLVEKAVQQKMTSYRDEFNIKEKKGENYSYHTNRIHHLQKDLVQEVRMVLEELEKGNIKKENLPSFMKRGKFSARKEGILAEVSLGSLRRSSLFANVGPTIPMRLYFTGQIHSDIDVEVVEYGLNNAMVKMNIILEVREQVTMPFSSKQKKIKIKVPIAVDLFHGEVPDYYQDYIK